MVGGAGRRRRFDSSGAHWPGFVDAMATLLLVIIFLLTVFVVAQFLLAREISGRDTALIELRSQLAELTDLLSLERAGTRSLQASLAGLTDDVGAADSERTRLASLVADLEAKNSTAEQQVILLQDKLDDETRGRLTALAELEQQQKTIVDLRSEADRRQAQLTDLESDLATAERDQENARVAATAQEAVIVDLRSEAEKNAVALSALQGEVAATASARDRSQAEVESQRFLIVDLRQQVSSAGERLAEVEGSLESEREAREKLAAALIKRNEADEAARAKAEEPARRLVVLTDQLKNAEAEREAAVAELEAAQERLIVLQDENRIAAAAQEEADRQRQIVIDLRKREGEQTERANTLAGSLADAEQSRDSALQDIELLNVQLAALRRQIGSLQDALGISEERDIEQRAQISDLGRRLNVALAQKVKELSRYRSEFFGRLRQILSDRSDIRVVGDRFVFQSEVLFPSASATINPAGRSELDKLAEAIILLEAEIPPEFNWVLRVDGHTDRESINTVLFQSNWELASARAISVVRHLIARGVAPHRLVAAGFGEFQPLDDAETEEAFSRNRRIELKLTER